MLEIVTLFFFSVFLLFQLLYLIVPAIRFIRTPPNPINIQEQEEVTLLIPAYNEENIISTCIDGLLQLDYTRYQAMIVNDGSTDDTMGVLQKRLCLKPVFLEKTNLLPHNPVLHCYQSERYPRIFVVDKINGGKADALNAGIEYASGSLVVTLDADCVLSPNSIHAVNTNFKNQNVIAAGGAVHILQGVTEHSPGTSQHFKVKGLIKYQIIQYLTAFYLFRTTQEKFNGITVISGAFGVFRKYILHELNGFRKTIGEDMDITLRVHKLIRTLHTDKRICFIPQAVCYTECPEDFRDLFRQRFRWQKCFVDCIITYWSNLFKELGLGVSIYMLIDGLLLGTIAAFSTLFFYVALLFNYVDTFYSLIIFAISAALGLFQSIASLLICKQFGFSYSVPDSFRYYLFALIEPVSYRILGIIFCTLGTILYFFDKHGWNKVKRSGKQYAVTAGLTTCSSLKPIPEKGEILYE